MSDTNELQAAVERLRRVKAGEEMRSVYGTRLWLQSRVLWEHDHKMLADAYLALGTRQPDEQRVYAASQLWDLAWTITCAQERYPDAKLVRVATFTQEIPEVPNAD